MPVPARFGILITALLHVAALAALLSYAPARSALHEAAPIMVDWITAPVAMPVIAPAAAPAEPPKPKRVAKRSPPKPIQPPEEVTAPQPPPLPRAAETEPAPRVAEAVTMAPAPAPVAVTAPLFNAAYLDNAPPSYPSLSRRLGEQGRVVLRVLVDRGGRASEVQVRASSGSERLDESARATVRGWKFVPAKRGSEPVAEWVLIPISFKLES
jgi:protein TonB